MPSSAKQIIAKLRAHFRGVSFAPSDYLPEKLCHYTSAAGVVGILKSGTLRASNFAYLNDSSEIRYGERIAREILHERSAHAEGRPQQVLTVTLKAMELIASQIGFYLTCFCTEPDLLSQWRGYGTGAGRFCLVFDPEVLANGTEAASPLYFGKVIYNESDQRARIAAVLDRGLEAVEEMLTLDPVEQKACGKVICDELFQKLIREMCFLKHPGFSEEHEWRAVHWLQDISAVDFEPRSGGIRPFVNLFSGRDKPPRLPIREIIVGYSAGAPAGKSVELMLERYGYTNVAVTESQLPYRDS